jgi:hypothetical protein
MPGARRGTTGACPGAIMARVRGLPLSGVVVSDEAFVGNMGDNLLAAQPSAVRGRFTKAV